MRRTISHLYRECVKCFAPGGAELLENRFPCVNRACRLRVTSGPAERSQRIRTPSIADETKQGTTLNWAVLFLH
jgi:hypothetical protein